VRVAATAAAGEVLITVADGCGGIPEADLARVFDLAWRAAAARTPDADGGAGLGLTIVRGIVEAHSGQVRVVNAGDGCSFEVRLPASAQVDSGDPGHDDETGSGPALARTGRSIPDL
jgi:signal transduction histidine kinase